MKILFAAPDRDLLACYRELLQPLFGEIVTAFDGTQVLSLLSAEHFDVLLLDRNIPRVEHKTILARVRESGIPVIVLTDEPVGVHALTNEPLPGAYLTYPFTAARLADVIRDTLGKVSSGERLQIGDLTIDVSAFRIAGGPSLTAGEIDAVRALVTGGFIAADEGARIGALNAKFAQAGSDVRIKYKAEKGFETVNERE